MSTRRSAKARDGAQAPSTSSTGAERVIQVLFDLGVEHVFGLPGVHNLPIWEALANSPIRLILVHHEQAAAYAADGYARTTGKLGVCLVTSGPGAANTVAATGEAMASGTPLLVIATDISTTLRRQGVYRGVLHETRDQAAMFGPITKHAKTLDDANDIGAELLNAAHLACTAPAGPVYVGIPTNLLSASAAPREPAPGFLTRHFPSDGELATALLLIGEASNPLIWAGGGARRADAGGAIARLAELLVAPVVTTYMGRGVLPSDHPCLVYGSALLPEVGALWDEADLVISVGSDFDGTMTQNWQMPPPRSLLSINVDPADASKNYRSDLVLAGDAREVTERLVAELPPRSGLPNLARRLRELRKAIEERLRANDAEAMAFVTAMAETVPKDAPVLLDMCIPAYWLVSFFPADSSRQLHYPVGWGTLGFALPASIGGALAKGQRAICVCGDGGFLFACGELVTLIEEALPVTIILVDDGGYGMLRFDQMHAGSAVYGVNWKSPDFVALARAFGLPVTKVTDLGPRFQNALGDAFTDTGPNMVVVEKHLKPPPTTFPHWYRQYKDGDVQSADVETVAESITGPTGDGEEDARWT